MLKREYKNSGLMISALGLGMMRLPRVQEDKTDIDYEKAQEIVDYAYSHGINYFDTAYPYHGGTSEEFTGKALSKYPRDSYFLATKFPIWAAETEADLERIFNEQLQRTQAGYFDFYLLHALNAERVDKIQKLKVYEFFAQKKAEGKIRHLGFSFHDTPAVLERICSLYEWDFAQIQLNYLDWEMQDAKGQYEVLTKHGIPVIVMEPVHGGTLAHPCDESVRIFEEAAPGKSAASWAIRFAESLPNVQVVLSGMSTMDQIRDNVATMSDFQPLTDEERAVIEKALDAYKAHKTIPCTGCRYCMDCPFGVNIPLVFQVYNRYRLDGSNSRFKKAYSEIPESARAENCQECGACMTQCPQSIKIPEHMKEIDALWAEVNK